MTEREKELHDLKINWTRDPCFDLEDHAETDDELNELSIYSTKWKIKWNKEHIKRLIRLTDQFNEVERAFRLDEMIKENWALIDKLFTLTGRTTLDYLP